MVKSDKKISNQRLRNLTTGRMHTNANDIKKDLEFFTEEEGIADISMGGANAALLKFLKVRLPDKRFWEDKYDATHDGSTLVSTLTFKEKEEWKILFSK